MKIAILDPVGIKAGMNCYDIGLLNGLSDKGHEVYCFSNFSDKQFSKVQQYSYFLDKKKGTLQNLINFTISHFKALITCKIKKIDIVILHVFSTTIIDFFSFFLTKIFFVKTVAIIHDINSLSDEDKWFIKNFIYDTATFLVVHNQTSKKEIEPLVSSKNKQKLHIIPHGNYIHSIPAGTPQSPLKSMFSFDNKYKYLLFFGQIKRVKGLDILIKAMAHMDDNVKLIIAGRPHRDKFEDYESLMKECGVENKVIPFIRFITDDERDYLFKNVQALILPYRKIYQSGVLLLAMSYGLPVIASDLPANKEIINSSNGVLFSDGNSDALALRIKELLSVDNEQILRTNAYNTALYDFSWAVISEKYEAMINKRT